MSDGTLATQQAIFTLLDAALSVPVYDHVPQNTSAPFVAIGEFTGANVDTKTFDSIEQEFEIHIYSSLRGLTEVKTTTGLIYDALQKVVLSITGFNASPCRYTFSTSFIEPDGARGVMRFSLETQPE